MLRLRGRRVAIEAIHDPDRIGSIIIPDVAKNRADQGIVKYAGPDCLYIKPGDHVLFSTHTGFQVHIDREGTFLVMLESALMCVIESSSTTIIPGVYLKDNGGEYFPATHEILTELIARYFMDPGKRSVSITDKRPGMNLPDVSPLEDWDEYEDKV